MSGGNVMKSTESWLYAPITEYADLVLHPRHDRETLLETLMDPYQYAHVFDIRARKG